MQILKSVQYLEADMKQIKRLISMQEKGTDAKPVRSANDEGVKSWDNQATITRDDNAGLVRASPGTYNLMMRQTIKALGRSSTLRLNCDVNF